MSKKDKQNPLKNIKSKNLIVDGKLNLEKFEVSDKIKEIFFNKDKIFKTIGILGGSFNPIHKGHLEIIESLLSEFKVDEVWLLIAYQKEHSGGEATKSLHRMNMVDLALKENNLENKVKICTSEIDKKKFVPTLDTLKELSHENPNKSFLFAFGSDHVPSFTKWDNIEEIKKYTKLVCYERKGSSLTDKNKKLLFDFPCLLSIKKRVDISSTDIRNGLKVNFLSSSVLKYIKEHKLYNKKTKQNNNNLY